jgi:hypothetical protein
MSRITQNFASHGRTIFALAFVAGLSPSCASVTEAQRSPATHSLAARPSHLEKSTAIFYLDRYNRRIFPKGIRRPALGPRPVDPRKQDAWIQAQPAALQPVARYITQRIESITHERFERELIGTFRRFLESRKSHKPLLFLAPGHAYGPSPGNVSSCSWTTSP